MSGAAYQMRSLMDQANRLFVPVADPPADVWADVARRLITEPDGDLLLQMLGVAPYRPFRRSKKTGRKSSPRTVWTHNSSGYKSGCRCDVCREAIREYRRTHRPPVRVHGTETAYRNGGCRCDLCRHAAAVAQRARKDRAKPAETKEGRMICKSCCKRKHRKCEDNDPKTGQQRTDYRGCCCQHKTAPILQEPVTGTHGD